MAYDLIVTSGPEGQPVLIGSIEAGERAVVSKLSARTGSFLFACLSDLFTDQTLSVAEMEQAQAQLFGLLPAKLDPDERVFVHKMVSVFAFALDRGEPVRGVAD